MLSTARKLARSAHRPRQSDLRRAVSTAYYALFEFWRTSVLIFWLELGKLETIRAGATFIARLITGSRKVRVVRS